MYKWNHIRFVIQETQFIEVMYLSMLLGIIIIPHCMLVSEFSIYTEYMINRLTTNKGYSSFNNNYSKLSNFVTNIEGIRRPFIVG